MENIKLSVASNTSDVSRMEPLFASTEDIGSTAAIQKAPFNKWNYSTQLLTTIPLKDSFLRVFALQELQ